MSKPSFIKIMAASLLAGNLALAVTPAHREIPTRLPVGAEALFRAAIRIPAGDYVVGSREPGCYPVRSVALAEFHIWPVEVSRGGWEEYQSGSGGAESTEFRAAAVSYEDAEAFCRWFSDRYQVTARLPTVEEWEVAARAGTPGVPYPWGWGHPAGRAVFDVAAAAPPASHAPNPWGLFDMAGNLAEWCQAEPGAPDAPVMGGSWAERDPRYLRISHRLHLPKTYRDADVGFRVVIEAPDPR